MSRRPQGRHIHRAAAAIAYAVNEVERLHPDWQHITPAGEFRRGCELVGALSLVAVDPKLRGKDRTEQGDQLTIHVTSRDRYGIALLLATGSDQHLEALRARAAEARLHAGRNRPAQEEPPPRQQDRRGHLRSARPALHPARTARNRRAKSNAPPPANCPSWSPPKICAASCTPIPTESDGADTLEEMAKATRQRGYAYLGLTDHSQTAHYAGGLKADEVLAQQKEIDKLNKRSARSFHVFKGIESDILGDGSLDYPDDILDRFDLVIASVHSKFRMGKKEQTDRIVKAIENPHTTILGHVTGRQLLRRPGYEVDMERILKACAKHGVAIEINAHPWRLDMDWRWCERALELGCLFSIDPDAHSTDEIDNLQWGVLMARKGGVPKERVLNALDLAQFRAHLEARKARRKAMTSADQRRVTAPRRITLPAETALTISPELCERAQAILKTLKDKGLSIVTAESCTAGMIAAVLSRADGAGEVLHGGFVTYTKAHKQTALGVSRELLRDRGAVNEESSNSSRPAPCGAHRLAQLSPSAACSAPRRTKTAIRSGWFIFAA